MSLYISSLNSGSNGNCYYVGNGTEAVLVDVGISCREVEKRMLRSGLNIRKVKAIFISHEHHDHIRGVEVLSRKYKLPVYITSSTFNSSRLILDKDFIRSFKAYEPVAIGGLSIWAFPKLHDAADPHSFIITYAGIKVGVLTDIGAACEHVIQNFRQCHAAFLEANYDEEMLEKGAYPYHLKRRIQSNVGHLSNSQALQLFHKHKPAFMSHVLLSHLSKDNNSAELVLELFRNSSGKTMVDVASRYEETCVYQVSMHSEMLLPAHPSVKKNQAQISLF